MNDRIASAMSSGVQTLPSAARLVTACLIASKAGPRPCFSQLPSMKPGATAFTRIEGAQTRARVTVKLLRAALDAQ